MKTGKENGIVWSEIVSEIGEPWHQERILSAYKYHVCEEIYCRIRKPPIITSIRLIPYTFSCPKEIIQKNRKEETSQPPLTTDLPIFRSERDPGGGGGTPIMFSWGCAAGTLRILTYTGQC